MFHIITANVEINGMKDINFRQQPLVTWLHFLNLITICIACFLFLKFYKTLVQFYEWLFPFKQISECPVILVVGPKNEIIQEIIFQLSQIFKSEIVMCQDLNGNSNKEFMPKKKLQKSLLICNHETLNSQRVITEFKTRVEKAFGFVDVLIVSQVEKTEKNNSTQGFLNHLNEQLLVQFWIVMAFLPGMLRRNRGHILSVALGRTSLSNTGIMRSIHEEILQCDTEVKLTLVESNTIVDNNYLPPLSSSMLASFILRSMWNCNAVVKVPSLSCYLIMLPVLLVRSLLEPLTKMFHHALPKILSMRTHNN